MIIAKHFTLHSRSYDLSIPTDNHKLRFGICDINDICYVMNSNLVIDYNHKYFVTSTYSKGTGKIKMYIDGKLDSISNN